MVGLGNSGGDNLARINIDDSLYTDSRFLKLCIKLGDIHTAVGAVVRVWTVAQKWFVKPEKDIPEGDWKKQGLMDEVIEVGLAVYENGMIHVCGAEEQFAWLTQRIEAGRKGGLAKSEGLATAKRPLAEAKQTLANVPSYSYSYSSSISNSPKEEVVLASYEGEIHPELLGIQDDFFRRLTQGAQNGWLKKFGAELIRQHVPLFYSAYMADKPRDKWGNVKSAVFYINNCLETQMKNKANGHSGEYTADDLAVIFGTNQ